MRDPSHICDLHHSSRQCRILNPLSKARDRTHNLMVSSQIRFRRAMMGTHSLLKYSNFSKFFPSVLVCSGLILSDMWWALSICSFIFLISKNFLELYLFTLSSCFDWFLSGLLLYIYWLFCTYLSYWNPLLTTFHLFLHFFLIFKTFLFSSFIFLKALSVVFFHFCVSSSLIFISERVLLCIFNPPLNSLVSFLNFMILVYVFVLWYLVLFTSFSMFGIL